MGVADNRSFGSHVYGLDAGGNYCQLQPVEAASSRCIIDSVRCRTGDASRG